MVPARREFEMLADGVVLDSGDDMAAAWPTVLGDRASRKELDTPPRRGAGPQRFRSYKNSISIGIRNAVAFRYSGSARARMAHRRLTTPQWSPTVYLPREVHRRLREIAFTPRREGARRYMEGSTPPCRSTATRRCEEAQGGD